jgi:hypothetical protein
MGSNGVSYVCLTSYYLHLIKKLVLKWKYMYSIRLHVMSQNKTSVMYLHMVLDYNEVKNERVYCIFSFDSLAT